MQLNDDAVSRYFVAHRAIAHRDSPAKGAAESQQKELDAALEDYRKAATNVPRNDELIDATWQQLQEAASRVAGLREHMQKEAEREKSIIAAVSDKDAKDSFSPAVMEKMQKVAHGIYVGSYHPANDPKLLKTHGITHICCCINVAPRHPHEFAYITLPADDANGYDITQHFAKTYDFIDGALTQGGGVLIHCGAGISRAPTITAAYLIRKLGITAEEAVRRIKKVRPCASPNLGFSQQLRDFAKQLQRLQQSHAAPKQQQRTQPSNGSTPAVIVSK
jgi:protein-tyrosine phosphatase